MKKLLILGLPLMVILVVVAQKRPSEMPEYCHDTETGEYRLVRPTDDPLPMKPHGGRPEFEKPHLQCNPSKGKSS
jgi:hypothetical protein